jgi:large subunit ribosomal protein L24
MKLRVNDRVIVTAGKDKGKKSRVTAVYPALDAVVVEGANIYVRHQRKTQGKPGEIVRKERPLSTAKVAILNDKDQPDRVGYLIREDGKKVRIYKKTKIEIKESKS